jgi:hypothetical protein
MPTQAHAGFRWTSLPPPIDSHGSGDRHKSHAVPDSRRYFSADFTGTRRSNLDACDRLRSSIHKSISEATRIVWLLHSGR